MKFKKIEVEGKTLYLKRDEGSFRIVHPIHKEDGSINWFNLLAGGSWKNLIITGVIILIISGVIYEYSTVVNVANECLKQTKIIIIP